MTEQIVTNTSLPGALPFVPDLAPIPVRVLAPWRVCHEGRAYVQGDEVIVPGHVAAHWERSAWVERVKVNQTRADLPTSKPRASRAKEKK